MKAAVVRKFGKPFVFEKVPVPHFGATDRPCKHVAGRGIARPVF